MAAAHPERARAAFETALEQAVLAGTPYERALVLGAYADHLRRMATKPEQARSMEVEALTVAQHLRLSKSDPPLNANADLHPATT
jgi:hypothetical protein